jgi:hypothetical protein
MASSIREQIASAIVAALSAAGGPTGLTVHRERTRPIETDSLPAIMVYFEADDAPKPFDKQKYRSPFVERTLVVALECRAQGSASTPPDQALDPITVWATQRMFADETFGTLAIGADEGATKWYSREGDLPVAAATIRFSVVYRTSRLDPTKNPTNS